LLRLEHLSTLDSVSSFRLMLMLRRRYEEAEAMC
jgi:hypothetical protein